MEKENPETLAAILAGSELNYKRSEDLVLKVYRDLRSQGIPELPAAIMAGSEEIIRNYPHIDNVILRYRRFLRELK